MSRLVRCAVVALALLAVVGFAAEPTTSTQFDVTEGRGTVVVQSAHQLAAATQLDVARQDPVPVPPLLTLLAVGLGAVVVARRAHATAGHLTSLLGRATPARRGPPAIA